VSNPRVSVGIPVYNGEKHLQTAVDSVLEQDYNDFELIISDNASTDHTAEICRRYAATDKRVRYFRSDVNIGVTGNFNRVFALARGEFFKWLPSDDQCYPTLLRRCVEIFDQAPSSVALVFPFCETMDERGDPLGDLIEDVKTRSSKPYQRLRKVLLKRASAQTLLGLIRSEHLRRTGLRGSYVMEDMGLLAELSMVGQFWEVPEVLFRFRIHPGNAIKTHKTTRSHLIWLDPANETKRVVLSPHVQLFLEAFRSVWRVRLRPVDRVMCWLIVPAAYSERHVRNVAGRCRNRLFAKRGVSVADMSR
jgi:glycosyltransferase involved in cell wall biosynthesis